MAFHRKKDYCDYVAHRGKPEEIHQNFSAILQSGATAPLPDVERITNLERQVSAMDSRIRRLTTTNLIQSLTLLVLAIAALLHSLKLS